MVTCFCLKCPTCGARLLFLRLEGDEYILCCARGHQKRYSARYMQRFERFSADSSGRKLKVPTHCLSCGNPASHISTDRRSIICSICGAEMVYDDRKGEWVLMGEGMGV